jgi:O-antigen/teichoic acid export membrane protein
MIKKILSSSLWLLIGSSIGRLAMFLANIFAARMLSQEAFGQFAMIRSTISSIEGLISGTFGSTIIKEVARSSHEEKKNLPYILSTIFILNIIIAFSISIFIFFGADFIVEKFLLNNTILINALNIGILILITTTFANLIQNILIGFEEFRKLAILSIITSILSIPTIFILIYFFQFYGALFGIIFYFTLDSFIKYFYFKKLNILTKFELDKFKNESKSILIFIFPIFLTFLINGFSFWYARVLVVNGTNSFEEIAIFDAAFQWLTIIMIITTATTNVVLPKLSKTNSDNKEKRKIFFLGLIVNFLISFIISITFISFSKEIMSIYGNNYIRGYETLNILAITSIVFTISLYLNRFSISNNKSWILFIASFFGSIAMFSLIYFNLDALNIKYLAWSFFTYYCATIIIYLLKIRKC